MKCKDWEQRKLSEVCEDFEYGLNAAAKEYDGNNKYIRITDIDDISRTFSTVDLTSPDICLDGMSKYLLSDGDIVFARTGASVGKTYIYREKDGTVYFAGFLIRARVMQKYDSEFIFQNTLTPNYEKYVRITSQRSGQPGVNAQEYGEYMFFAPLKEEQVQIGKFLRELDDLITLHQRQGKQSIYEPSQKFQETTSAWEQRKVGELLIERNEQAPMNEEYPLMAFIANEGVAPKGERYDRSSLVTDTENKLYKRTECGDFIYSSNNLETGSIGLNKYGKACISPVYSIFQPTRIADSDFLGRRLVRKDFINAMVKWRQGVIYGQWRIHEADFLKIEIPVPSVEEQRKIGGFLDYLDNLITLHQRQGKQSIYEPSQKFQETTSAWEQRKFGETFDLLTNNTLSRVDLNDETGSVLNVHYGDILVKLGEIIDTETDHLPYISNATKVAKTAFLMDGDVIIADTAEDNTVGKCAEIMGISDKPVVSGLHTIPCRPRSRFARGYLGYFMNSPAFHDQLLPLMQGTKVMSVSKSSMADTLLCYPTDMAEQALIGQYFMKLDNLITLHQRELERLQNIKKSCLEKMFV